MFSNLLLAENSMLYETRKKPMDYIQRLDTKHVKSLFLEPTAFIIKKGYTK